jgi:hypothetical protein
MSTKKSNTKTKVSGSFMAQSAGAPAPSELPASPPPVIKAEKPESPYPIDIWLENSNKILGVPRWTVAGAIVGRSETEYTKSQLQAIIQSFSARTLR